MSERSQWEEAMISDEEAMEMMPALQALMDQPGWAIYQNLLKASRVNAREVALAQGKEKFDWWSGYVAGLNAAGALPQVIAQQVERLAVKAHATEKVRLRRRTSLSLDAGDVGGF